MFALPLPYQIACVSYLNSKPLIDPLVGVEDVRVHFAVPAALPELIERGTASAGLMSLVDYFACKVPLLLVPAGMIGCDGPTLTVRLFSRVPLSEVREVHADVESHTSVILAQVILKYRYGIRVKVVPFTNRGRGEVETFVPETMLLIGDKVVNAAPDAGLYPVNVDLGEEWKALTGLPFVFAMWMIRKDSPDVRLGMRLREAQRAGAGLTAELVNRHAVERGWPKELARRYFTEYLRYAVTSRAREGLAHFVKLTSEMGLIQATRTLEYLELPE